MKDSRPEHVARAAQALAAYQTDPARREAAAMMEPLQASAVSVDFESE